MNEWVDLHSAYFPGAEYEEGWGHKQEALYGEKSIDIHTSLVFAWYCGNRNPCTQDPYPHLAQFRSAPEYQVTLCYAK